MNESDVLEFFECTGVNIDDVMAMDLTLGGVKIHVKYDGQTPTCPICSATEHNFTNCRHPQKQQEAAAEKAQLKNRNLEAVTIPETAEPEPNGHLDNQQDAENIDSDSISSEELGRLAGQYYDQDSDN